MEITGLQLAEQIMTKYQIHCDIVTNRFIMNIDCVEHLVHTEYVAGLIDKEVALIQREMAEDALLAEHEVMWDEATDRFRVTFHDHGKAFKRIMTRGQFKRFFDTKLKSMGY